MAVVTVVRPTYLAWPSRPRAGRSVGTWSVHGVSTGAAGGGTHVIQLQCSEGEFGFPSLLVVKFMSAHDDKASAESVLFDVGVGRRSLGRTGIAVDMVAISGQNYTRGDALTSNYPLIEPDGEDLVIGAVTWPTNTDAKSYHLVAGGLVYDMQKLARGGWMEDPY